MRHAAIPSASILTVFVCFDNRGTESDFMLAFWLEGRNMKLDTTPVIGEYDFVVAGGGFAGFGGSVAAARKGLRVLLVERLEMLGGAGSAAGVGNFSYGREHVRAQGRVFDDILKALEKMNAIGEENGYREHIGRQKNIPVYNSDGSGEFDEPEGQVEMFFNRTFNHTVLPYVLQFLALKNGVDILYATDVIGAEMDGDKITHVVLHNRSLTQKVKAKVFLDATGDGILSGHAGATILGTEDEHPDVIQPGNMLFMHRVEEAELMPTLEPELLKEEPDCKSIWPEPTRVGIKMRQFHKTFDTSTGRGYSEAVIDFRRNTPNFVRYFQENYTKNHPSDGGYAFSFAAPMLGYRESRRVEGDYILKKDDLIHGRRFDDGVAYAGSVLDSQAIVKAKVPFFQIPYRCLTVKNLDNLLVAGRCFSATRVALSSTRVMATGCLMGQACGYSAALALRHGTAIRDVEPIGIRKLLLEDADHRDVMAERLESA